MNYTYTETRTFTATHAKHIAAKVATDLKRLQRFYGSPSDTRITQYEAEVIELLKEGYLEEVSYGFRRSNRWIEPTLKYSARMLTAGALVDDDPGRIRPGADISGATFYSFLTYSSAWYALSHDEREAFLKRLIICRGFASEPGIDGYLTNDLCYSAGGRSLNRSSVRGF